MPPSVNVTYSAGYAETEIGQMAEMGAGVIKAFLQGGMDKNTFSKQVKFSLVVGNKC